MHRRLVVLVVPLLVAVGLACAPPPAPAPGVQEVSAGAQHSCGITTTNGVRCWGDNEHGKLGDGSTTDSSVPVDVVGLSSGVRSVVAGGDQSCALLKTGRVKCWGFGGAGQLGVSSFASSPTPVFVDGLTNAVALAGTNFANHVCALTSAGGVKCWGHGGYGELGNGAIENANAPVDVVGLTSGVASISAGGSTTCAVTVTGGARCWGWNIWGQLGNGEGGGGLSAWNSVPVDVMGLSSGVAEIAAGGYFTCALMTAGGAKCWGLNFQGQLGANRPPEAESNVPVDVVGLTDAVAIAAGWVHTCTVRAGGGMKCWGDNEWGQVGNGTTTTGVGAPVDVQQLGGRAIQVTAGERHTCARLQGNVAKCWGWNEFGQLGNGETTDRSLPVPVITS